jgi:uncharacterized membrane protein
MPIFVDNFNWMLLNVTLAFIPLILAGLLRRKMKFPLYVVLLLMWMFFLPNTIYLITDMQYFPGQFIKAELFEQVALFIQYILLTFLGVFTYFYGLDPIERAAREHKLSPVTKNTMYIAINFVVAFAVILGKVQRTHSWYIVTDTVRVILDINRTLTTPYLVMWIVAIGVLINVIFFTTHHYFFKISLGEVRKKKYN